MHHSGDGPEAQLAEMPKFRNAVVSDSHVTSIDAAVGKGQFLQSGQHHQRRHVSNMAFGNPHDPKRQVFGFMEVVDRSHWSKAWQRNHRVDPAIKS